MKVALPVRLDADSLRTLCQRLRAARGPILLEGSEPGTFCLGLDVDSVGHAVAGMDAFLGVLELLGSHPGPVAAWVDGAAVGGGLGLAAACDLVVASERARFALPELLLGIVPGAILPVLRDRMSPQAIRLLALRGASVDPVQAASLGLVDLHGEGVHDAERALRALRRAEVGAIAALRELLRAGSLLSAEEGASATLSRLHTPQAQERLARMAAGDAPWGAS